jgi:HTH-type transcriptional regulator/antitoxin HigA
MCAVTTSWRRSQASIDQGRHDAGIRERAAMMTPTDIERIEALWPAFAPYLFVPRTDAEYDRLTDDLDALTDRVGEDETHPLASLMEVIGSLIDRYEDESPLGY